MNRRAAIVVIAFLGVLLCVREAARAELPVDQMKTLELGAPAPNWVYVLDAQYPAAMISKIHIIDGDTQRLLGQVNGGYLSNFEMSPDHRELYMIDTYYSRGWRGTRTDVVSIFDTHTLAVTGEIKIPPKRILIVPKPDSTALTSDGRFLFVANMTPATSVSVVDLKARRFIGEIDTPGCAQVLAAGNRRFASMCGDGSMLTVDIDDSGKLTNRKQGKPFFDPNSDPVFDQPVMIGATAYFVSYHGMVHAVDLAGAEAIAEPQWPIVSGEDQNHSWRPGGWQVITADRKAARLYIMMHQGGEWTHKQFGKEVWVFDAATKKRLSRIPLKTEAYSILLSQGDKPLLFGLSLLQSQLETYSAADGKYLGVYQGLGTPFVLYGTQ
jgi:methylamine dehydrogenase heavy chain